MTHYSNPLQDPAPRAEALTVVLSASALNFDDDTSACYTDADTDAIETLRFHLTYLTALARDPERYTDPQAVSLASAVGASLPLMRAMVNQIALTLDVPDLQ